MSKKFSNVDSYDATVDQLWAMLSSKEYWEQKYASMGATDFEWATFNSTDDELTVSSVRKVAANLPGAAKKVIGDTAEVTQTEHWVKSGNALTCDIKITTKGAPGGTTGTMAVESAAPGSRWTSDFDIKINIPMLGKKLEGIMYDETGENFVVEKEFNDEWISSH